MQPVTAHTLKVMWAHTMRYKPQVIVIAVTLVIGALTSVLVPVISRELINALTDAASAFAGRELLLVWAGFGLALAHQVNYRIMFYMVIRVQARVMSDLYDTCYNYTMRHSYGFFADTFAGAITTRVKRFHHVYERITDTITLELGFTAIRVAIIVAVLFTVNSWIALMALAWVVLFVGISYAISQYKLRHDIRVAEQDTTTTAHLADTVTNSHNMHLYASQVREGVRFAGHTDRLYGLRRYSWNLSNWFNIPQGLLMSLLELGVMYMAVTRVQGGLMTVGELVMIQGLLLGIFERLWGISHSIKNLYEALADANEMTQILLTPHEIQDQPDAGQLKVRDGRIEFDRVSFHYQAGSQIIRNLSLTVRSGEKIALVGKSGSGKSTLVRLLLRLKDINDGSIRIDGQDIARVTQASLRTSVAHVPQDPVLFHRSLLENIRYGKPDATDQEVTAAAKAAHAHQFITRLKDGYGTLVGERGIKLSGGERQRVAIARAILQDAPILVLDEATSSLDSEAEAHIQAALKNLMRRRTTIVIAHRLSTIRQMDRIVVMREGVIVEEGRHEELIQSPDGEYQRLWKIQTQGFAAEEDMTGSEAVAQS